jgi:hypothetical protein
MMRILKLMLFWTLIVIGVPTFGKQTSAQNANIYKDTALCASILLPTYIQETLTKDFKSWKIKDSSQFNKLTRERWQAELPHACPGIAIGKFENAKLDSYAILLVPREHQDGGYKLLAFTPSVGKVPYEIRTIEHSSDVDASQYFVHRVPISQFFDKTSRTKFRVLTNECILFVYSGENEYETDVYFWTKDGYRHEPVDY